MRSWFIYFWVLTSGVFRYFLPLSVLPLFVSEFFFVLASFWSFGSLFWIPFCFYLSFFRLGSSSLCFGSLVGSVLPSSCLFHPLFFYLRWSLFIFYDSCFWVLYLLLWLLSHGRSSSFYFGLFCLSVGSDVFFFCAYCCSFFSFFLDFSLIILYLLS